MAETITQNRLMTTDEFNQKVTEWETKVDNISSGIISVRTHGKGILRNSLEGKTLSVDEFDKAITKIGFLFNRYGVFVHYGVGRGYTRINGVVVRGYNLYNAKKKQWRNKDIAGAYAHKGYKNSEIRKMKMGYENISVINRRPVDFLDGTIDSCISELADIAGEYYGDKAMKAVLNKFDKFKIQK